MESITSSYLKVTSSVSLDISLTYVHYNLILHMLDTLIIGIYSHTMHIYIGTAIYANPGTVIVSLAKGAFASFPNSNWTSLTTFLFTTFLVNRQ